MLTVTDPSVAAALCVVTMIGWGSWANTQKLAGKERWPFELYYWDYAFGVFVAGLLFCLLFDASDLFHFSTANGGSVLQAVASGALFNAANILLVVAIDAGGMSLAFPLGIGLALVIGTGVSYRQTPKGDVLLLGAGVLLIIVAMVVSAVANKRIAVARTIQTRKAILFAVAAGCLMGFFYPQLTGSMTPLGALTPYTALVCFGIGLLGSNLFINTLFMRVQGSSFGAYRAARPRLHLLGLAGGAIWMTALTTNVLAAGVAGPAVSYALGQGATLVAALWGVFVWREYRGADAGILRLVAVMLASYAAGLLLIGKASL